MRVREDTADFSLLLLRNLGLDLLLGGESALLSSDHI